MTQPHPELNPIGIEHRLTDVEAIVRQTVSTVRDMAEQNKVGLDRMQKAEEAIRELERKRLRDAEHFQGKVDEVTDALSQRELMEQTRVSAFQAGQASVVVRIPIKQLTATAVLMSTLVGIAVAAVNLIT